MFCLIRVLSLLLAAAAVAQGPAPTVLQPRPDGNAIALAVVWPHPAVAGVAPGRERVLAECRRAAAEAAAGGLSAAIVHVDPEVAVVAVVVGAGPRALAAMQALLLPSPALSDDVIALQVARTALQLDDAAFLYPGDLLRQRAQVALGLEAPADAEAAILATAALSPAAVRAALASQRPSAWGALGAVPPSLPGDVAAISWPALAVVDAAGRCSVRAPSAPRAEEVHARTDAPWVLAAFPAPDRSGAAEFAVAVEVARARAVRAFRHRGREADARAPSVAWSPLHGDALVRFHRRGEHARQLLPGERIEADAAAEAAATEAELVAFLADLRSRPPTPVELQRSRDGLLAEFGFALPDDRPLATPLLPHWLLAALLLPARGIDASTLARVTPEAVHQTWQRLLVPGAGHWHRLLPRPRSDVSWRQR